MTCRRMVIKEGKVVPYEGSGIEEAGLHPQDKGGLRPKPSSIGTTKVSNTSLDLRPSVHERQRRR
jgi:hypothetical protein